MIRGIDHSPLLRCTSILEEVDMGLLEKDKIVVGDAVEERGLAGVGLVHVQLHEAEGARFTGHCGGAKGGCLTGCEGVRGPLRSHLHE